MAKNRKNLSKLKKYYRANNFILNYFRFKIINVPTNTI